MRRDHGSGQSWAHPSGIHLWCALPRPTLLHRGRESLSHVLQLEIHSLPESVWTLPSLFPWSVSTSTWKRNCMRARFFRSTKWLTCAYRWLKMDRLSFSCRMRTSDSGFEMHSITRGKICDLLRYSLRLCYGPSAVLSRSPFCWHGASLSGLRELARDPRSDESPQANRAPKTRAATESAPV